MSSVLHRLHSRRVLEVLAVLGVLATAAVVRFWALGRPDSLVFDELYYVRDAVSQLAHGFTTTWPDDSPEFNGERATEFSDEPNAIAHPPLGKWIIALGIMLFGPESGWGWRFAVALSGVATVGAVMRIGWLMSRSLVVAATAGLFLAIDGVHIVLSRVALLDGILTTLIVIGALLVWHDQERASLSNASRLWWRRPWLLAASVVFGAAAAVKWSGLYAFAAFLVLITLRDWWLKRRARLRRPFLRAAAQAGVTALIALPAACIAYLASWVGWMLSPNAQNRVAGEPWWESLIRWHADALAWHSTLSAPHPFASHPASWPLGLRPTSMYTHTWQEGCPWSTGCVAAITPVPNLLVTWAGFAAIAFLAFLIIRAVWIAARHTRPPATPGVTAAAGVPVAGGVLSAPLTWAAAYIAVGFMSGWLPWLLTFSRSAVFQFYAVVLTPFSALALALVLASFGGWIRQKQGLFALAGVRLNDSPTLLRGRRIAVVIFAGAAIMVSAYFVPMWLGVPIAEWFWRAHLWLPGWR